MKRFVFALLLASGCGFTSTHQVVTGRPGAPWTGEVHIVLESAPVPPNLDEVAIVQAVGHGDEADLEHIIDGLKQQARALGCDNVVRVHIDQGNGTASASGVAARLRVARAAAAPAAPTTKAAPSDDTD